MLYGDDNPSAKLTYTLAKDEANFNSRPCPTLKCAFDEGNYVDYRHFNRYIKPRFEFDFGLSYTTFSYSDISINVTVEASLAEGIKVVGGTTDLWNEVAIATVKVTNTGNVEGADVVQLYLSFPKEADQPVHQLRGFERVSITWGESMDVEFRLRRRDMIYWDTNAQQWRIANGRYVFNVGHSSRDFVLTEEFIIGRAQY